MKQISRPCGARNGGTRAYRNALVACLRFVQVDGLVIGTLIWIRWIFAN